MHCQGCLATIPQALTAQPGMKTVEGVSKDSMNLSCA